MNRYIDDDGYLTPEGEMSYLRFRAGARTIREVLESAGPDWLIDEWLVSSATMVTGQPECGKSSLVASMAAAVSRRDAWLGAEVSTSRTGPVAIVVTDPSDEIQWAKKAVELGVDNWEIIRFSPERWGAIEELATSMECPLLVFDNITGAIEEGTINEADPNAILRPLGLIIAEGTPVVVIHHSDKSGRRDPMGPTAYKAWRRHGIHITGSGERRTLTREGNFGRFPDVVVHGTARGAAVEYKLAEVQPTPKSNRSPDRLDDNAEIAHWVVDKCQGVSMNQVADRIAREFPGIKASTRRQHLLKGPLSKMLSRASKGGSTVWSLKR
ncbi:AAA family ATPase [Mycobacterium sp. 94-17]|uniref:AAA family ATPase n=1 Tax=Mycobacterium sp. 94-17 TaxID=2986147 RepID=UPI002D1F53A7|nr:AAA family ATPase [Mycobacterium sp. 94-17]MEB4211296.1 AAA family ATPase [Mycobacterium sp. 94-17]